MYFIEVQCCLCCVIYNAVSGWNWYSYNYSQSYSTEYASSQASIDGLVQDWDNTIANALDILQSCTKALI